jgi:hypothetical protein
VTVLVLHASLPGSSTLRAQFVFLACRSQLRANPCQHFLWRPWTRQDVTGTEVLSERPLGRIRARDRYHAHASCRKRVPQLCQRIRASAYEGLGRLWKLNAKVFQPFLRTERRLGLCPVSIARLLFSNLVADTLLIRRADAMRPEACR